MKVKDSEVEISRLVLPEDTNVVNALYGGRLVEWMDNIASITAYKHARKNIVTGSIDSLFFISPIKLGDIVTIRSFVTYTTKSTMEIEIDVFSENAITGDKKITTQAFFTYVAIDNDGRPVEIPQIEPENDDEIKRYKEGEQRSAERLKRLAETKERIKASLKI